LAPGRRMYCVRTRTGVVQCTSDHSLLHAHDASPCRVRDVRVGSTRLLHERDDAELLRALTTFPSTTTSTTTSSSTTSAPVTPELAYVYGVCTRAATYISAAGGRCSYFCVWLTDEALARRCADALPFATSVTRDARGGHVYRLGATRDDDSAALRFTRQFMVDRHERQVPECVLRAAHDAHITQSYLAGLAKAERHAVTGECCEHADGRTLPLMSPLLAAGVWLMLRAAAPHRRGHLSLRPCTDVHRWHIHVAPATDATDSDEEGIYGGDGGDDQDAVVREIRAWVPEGSPRRQTVYVYDVETASHHFAVGPGEMVVHNTDSVMIAFNKGDDDAAFRRAFAESHRLAGAVTEHIGRKEVILEFEKVFWPYALWDTKKKYAGIKYEKLDKPGKYAKKGLPSVRRDKILFVRRNVDAVVEIMLTQRSPEPAVRLLRDQLDAFLDGHLPPSDFFIEKLLKKTPNDYAAKGKLPQHVRVARELAERDPQRAPKPGDLVAFVHVFDTRERRRREDAMSYEDYVAQLSAPEGDETGSATTTITTTTTTAAATATASTQLTTPYQPRYRLDTTYYLENLIQRVLGSFLDLEGFLDDPYSLFSAYIARARRQDSGQTALDRFGFGLRAPAGGAASAGGHTPLPMSNIKRRMKRAEERKRQKEALQRSAPRSRALLESFFTERKRDAAE